MIKIMFVCYGNICRSPMAEFLFKDFVKKEGKEKDFFIASAGTSSEELGNGVHYGTRKILDGLGISCSGKYAVKLKKEDYFKFDYFIGMERSNVRDMLRIFGGDPDNKIYRLKDFSPRPGDVIDPYYYGNFEKTYEDIKYGLEFLYNHIEKNMI